jgi:hypothetical protein
MHGQLLQILFYILVYFGNIGMNDDTDMEGFIQVCPHVKNLIWRPLPRFCVTNFGRCMSRHYFG